MRGPPIMIGTVFALALFTIFLIIKSEDGWKATLTIMFLMVLASISMTASILLIMLVLLKISFDQIDDINDVYNPPEGMIFSYKK